MTAERRTRRARRWGLVAGVSIATFLPLVNFAAALLWDNGIVELDPDGPFVGLLQGTAFWELLLGPIGVVVALLAARVRSVLTWTATFLVAVPALAILWFVAVAYLGGLAGEPF